MAMQRQDQRTRGFLLKTQLDWLLIIHHNVFYNLHSLPHSLNLASVSLIVVHFQVYSEQTVLLPHRHPVLVPLCHYVHHHPACARHAHDLCSQSK